MAKVTITLEDVDGGTSVNISSDPPFTKDTELSEAQEIGMGFMMSMEQESEHVHGEHCNHHAEEQLDAKV